LSSLNAHRRIQDIGSLFLIIDDIIDTRQENFVVEIKKIDLIALRIEEIMSVGVKAVYQVIVVSENLI